jgi:hypothetical protein
MTTQVYNSMKNATAKFYGKPAPKRKRTPRKIFLISSQGLVSTRPSFFTN